MWAQGRFVTVDLARRARSQLTSRPRREPGVRRELSSGSCQELATPAGGGLARRAMTKPILVVEDDAATREFVVQALVFEGYRVLAAADGQEALELVERHEPGLILVDVLMPRLDGITFAHLYQARPGPHAPILVLTAALHPGAVAQKMSAAASLAKPFDLEELLALVTRFVPS